MNDLLVGLLGALLASNQPAAISNLVAARTGLTVHVPDPSDPVEREYLKLLTEDNAAQAEVARWIEENDAFSAQGAGIPEALLKLRIKQRLDPVRRAYEDFLKRHPNHVNARVAHGSFLNDLGEEEAAAAQWRKALELDPNNPAVWNNLGNHYGHNGPVEKAFECYEKAIALKPQEPVYYQNYGDTVFLFRRPAMARYGLTEQEVFNRALEIYEKGRALDPENFVLAADVAKTYYLIKPLRIADAKKAWQNALRLARDDDDRQGVCIHLARWAIYDGDFDAARDHLAKVTIERHLDTKATILRNLAKKEAAKAAAAESAPGTKSPATPK